MGFNEDIAEHLSATAGTSIEKAVGAVLALLERSQGVAVPLDVFDERSGQMTVGFQEKGAGQMARNWLKGGYGGVFSAVKRHRTVSPEVSITISSTGEGAVSVETKIERYSFMEGTFHRELIGRDPHRRFLTDLGVALRGLDSRAAVSIKS